jgi:hypothetical protein
VADASIKLHRAERAATLHLRGLGSSRFQLGELRDLRAQLDAAIAAIDTQHADQPRVTADLLARSFSISFERLRELDRRDPVGAANLRSTIAAEVQRWHQRDAVPLTNEARP